MWASACEDLRLSSEEFWNMTPREIDARYTAYMKRVQRECWTGTAQICAILAEINRDKKKRKKPYLVSDFIPGNKPKDDDKQDPYAIIRRMDSLAVRMKAAKIKREQMEKR